MVGLTIPELTLLAEFAKQSGIKILRVGDTMIEFWDRPTRVAPKMPKLDQPVHPAIEFDFWLAKARDQLNHFYASSGATPDDEDVRLLAEQLRDEQSG